jgi:hypothetical protein
MVKCTETNRKRVNEDAFGRINRRCVGNREVAERKRSKKLGAIILPSGLARTHHRLRAELGVHSQLPLP